MTKSTYLSPSTQESNIGKGSYGTEEKRMNQIADVAEKILKAHGITVYRNNPEMSLKQLVADSNGKKVDLHFAIHSNAGGGRGCEVYCHKFGGKGEKLARAVYNQIAPLTLTADRGVKEGCNHFGIGKPLYELAFTTAPAALIEIAFHDNAKDAEWILQNIDPIGTALAKGVLEYFGIEYIEKNPQDPKPDSDSIKIGTVVEIKQEASKYYPGGAKIPGWVKKDYLHKVTQKTSNGKAVIKNGKPCVLLGIKIRKTDKKEFPGINTWVATDNLTVIPAIPNGSVYKMHTVAKGDTLWDISQKYLGSGLRYPEIMARNNLQSTLLEVGQVLKIPKNK